MTNAKIRKLAAEVLESKLGFKVSSRDITLLESGGDETHVDYIAFKRFGFDRIEYRCHLAHDTKKWEMQIVDTYTLDSIYM